jgi:hypothetical protein
MSKISFACVLESVTENHREKDTRLVHLRAPADHSDHVLIEKIDLEVNHPNVKEMFARQKVGRLYRVVIEEIDICA